MMLKTYENRFKYPMHENQGAKVSNFEKEKYKRQYLVNNELTLLIKYLYVLFTKKYLYVLVFQIACITM